MSFWGKRLSFGIVASILCSFSLGADKPVPWQMLMQEPASPVAHNIVEFHNMIMVILLGIAVFVFALLLIVIFRFNAKKNPVPTTTTHHTMLEVFWTLIPTLIVLFIMVPSVKLLYFSDKTPDAEMTLKVVGHQWYWSYEYPDHGNITFDSRLVPDSELKKGQLRLLEVDNRVVLPVNTNIRIILTSTDVLHSWAVPSFGIKTDTVPGRLNETWVRIEREGVFYGQCSELCGVDHGFMPIAVEAVSKEKFQEWVNKAKPQQQASLQDQMLVKLAQLRNSF